MNADDVIAALDLPKDARVDQRVPKKLMTERGAPTSADKKRIQEGIEELVWFGVLKPTTVGIPAFQDDQREYLEIALLTADLRPAAKVSRIEELIHRAIPYPVLLLASHDGQLSLSMAHKRFSQGQADKMVVEAMVDSGPLDMADELQQAFLRAMPLARQPSRDLYALYEGWIAVIESVVASRLTGRFALIDANAAGTVAARRSALHEHERLTREIQVLRSKAAKEKQIARRAEMNLEIRGLQAALAAISKALS